MLVVGERWYPEVLASVLEELGQAKEKKNRVVSLVVTPAAQPVEAH